MKRLAASISAITLAVGAVLLAPSAAQADEATATISDPAGDVHRQPGVSKKDTSEDTKCGMAYDKNTVTVTWWFENLRKGTVKNFAVALYVPEYDVDYVLAKGSGVGAGLYTSLVPEGAVCGAEVNQKTGTNGWYRVSFDRSCLVPAGESGKVKLLVSDQSVVGVDDPDTGWQDGEAPLQVGSWTVPLL